MKRMSEAISENMPRLTRGQRLLAAFVTEHCDRAAFMSSFELAAVSGVSQSTVIRFASALGYDSYTDLQQALQTELKYRLSTLERFELLEDAESDDAVLEGIAAADSVNIRKNISRNGGEAIAAFCTRLSFAAKIYVYGQAHCAAAAAYLSSYLRFLMQNVCCLNQTGEEPLFAASDIDSGDLLLVISFPVHSESTRRLVSYARDRGAAVAVISESMDSEIAQQADAVLVCECGDFGVNGSMAPVISLCGSIVCLLARNDEKVQKRLRAAGEAIYYRGEQA